MPKFLAGFGPALFLVSASACAEPAQMGAAGNIECMDVGYTETELAEANRFVENYGLDDWQNGGLPPELEKLIVNHSKRCADKNEWSPEAAKQAVYYRVGSLLSAAIDKHTVLTPAQMAKLREAHSSADSARLISMMTPAVDAAFAGEATPMPSDADIRYLDEHITRRAGLPMNQEITSYVGAWLLTKGMVEVPKRRFNAP